MWKSEHFSIGKMTKMHKNRNTKEFKNTFNANNVFWKSFAIFQHLHFHLQFASKLALWWFSFYNEMLCWSASLWSNFEMQFVIEHQCKTCTKFDFANGNFCLLWTNIWLFNSCCWAMGHSWSFSTHKNLVPLETSMRLEESCSQHFQSLNLQLEAKWQSVAWQFEFGILFSFGIGNLTLTIWHWKLLNSFLSAITFAFLCVHDAAIEVIDNIGNPRWFQDWDAKFRRVHERIAG